MPNDGGYDVGIGICPVLFHQDVQYLSFKQKGKQIRKRKGKIAIDRGRAFNLFNRIILCPPSTGVFMVIDIKSGFGKTNTGYLNV